MNCLYCGKPITRKSHKKGGALKYCGMECFKAARGCKTYGTVVCMYCGKEFKETRDRPNKFCSNKCSALYRGHQNTLERLEQSEVNPETLKQYEEAKRSYEAVVRKLKLERRCAECGQWFVPGESGRKKYCSAKCSKRADNRRRDKRIYKNGQPDLSISLTKLYLRDGGICGICGRHIDFDCDSNADRYPSIDHIIPIAKGGLHRWDNVQLACRICNSIKSDE